MSKKQMRLGVFLHGLGHHQAAWRHPDVPIEAHQSLKWFQHLTQIAERGKLDMVFFADTLVFKESSNIAELARFEPTTLLSAVSAVTERIGLVATASTTYYEPFNLARLLASLDHISGGRAGWNVVTTSYPQVAENFGKDKHLERALRYEMAMEFVDVMKGLWDSWDEDAFYYDKSRHEFFDPSKLHELNHKGKYFSVKGPLNIKRPPQGYPVFIQASASDDGLELLGKTAEVVFSVQPSLQEAQQFYTKVKNNAALYGRNPDDVKVMPGVMPVIGRTEEEAKEKFEQLQSLINIDDAVKLLSTVCVHDLTGYPLDGPFPDVPDVYNSNSRFKVVADTARRENLTVRQAAQRFTGARGHRVIFGTPEAIADQLEQWFEQDAADGFNVMPPIFPNGLEEFVDQVVPILQKRGLFRKEYEGFTLRDHLGLPYPQSRYAK